MRENRSGAILERVRKCSPDIICVLDEEGEFLELSEAVKPILGYDSSEMLNRNFREFLYQEDVEKTSLLCRKLMEGSQIPAFENRYLHKSGRLITISWSGAWSDEDKALFFIGRKISTDAPVEESYPRNEKIYKALVDHGSDMVGLLDEQGNYLYVGGSTTKILGYSSDQMVGKNAFSFIHPHDHEKVNELWPLHDSSESLRISDVRFRAANGEWRWVEAIVSNQFANPAIGALVVSSRDVTERKNSRLLLEQSEQRFRSLFENNPDLVLFENSTGKIVEVNGAVETTFGMQKQNLLNRRLEEVTSSPIYGSAAAPNPPEGEVVKYTMEVEFERVGRKILSITRIPVMIDQLVTGWFSVIKDITAIAQSHKTLGEQAKKLNTIFESITDAFFSIDRNWNFTYINSEFDRLLRTDRNEILGKSILEVFPEEVNGVFFNHYREAIKTGKTVIFEAFLTRLGIWLEVKAYPSTEGLSVYFSDITEKVKAQEELKKLSVVASKSHNGIIIADKAGMVEWVNESFCKITGYRSEEALGTRAVAFLQKGQEEESNIKERVHRLNPSEVYEEEFSFINKQGRELWLKIEVIPVMDNEGELFRFIYLLSDISLQKQSAIERSRFIEELQRRNQSLNQFSHLVSHKLRAPVANILGLASLLNLPDLEMEVKYQVIEKLGVAANNLDSIIKDLNRILSLRELVSQEKERLFLDEALDEVIAVMGSQIDPSKIEIRRDFSKAPYVITNRNYLTEILYNLISNAINFRSPEKRTLIEIYSEQEGEFVSLYVKDNGLGIDLAKHQNSIFGLYKRFHTNIGGKGLGLYLVKTQVEAMGGKVEVNSRPGMGSEFKVCLR